MFRSIVVGVLAVWRVEMSDAESMTEPVDVSESPSAVPFGDDDLGRIQGILFGDYASKMLERVDTLEGALLGVIDDLRDHVEALNQRANDRIDAEAETRAKAIGNLTSRVEEDAKAARKEHAAINKRHDSHVAATSKAIAQAEENAAAEIASTRSALEDLIADLDRQLSDHKVGRADLAAVLRRAASEVDDPEVSDD